jgi:methionyl-tRNA formyltransferase
MAALRIVFCGTPEFAVPSLRHLAERPEFSIAAVITQPDRPRGRGQQVSASAVKEAALELGLHVYQPETIKSESAQEFLKRAAPDAVVIIAYGQIIPARLIEIPRLGWINLHGSLLPKYRGAAPIHWAIAKGETRTGLTTMQIDAGLDTGPMLLKHETEIAPDETAPELTTMQIDKGMDTGPTLLRREVAIGPNETAPELAARMSAIGADLITESLLQFDRGAISPVAQELTNVSYAPILKKEDGRIDWSRPAQQIYNRMRGFTPWPGSYTTFRGQTCHLWGRPAQSSPTRTEQPVGEISISGKEIEVTCGEGTFLRLESVQVEGRKKTSALEFANGARLGAGDRFE